MNRTDLLENICLCEGSSWTTTEFRSLTEEQKQDIAEKTVSKLFKDIKSKAFNLDFSDIEVGKGDVTKINGYANLKNAINFLEKMSTDIKSQDIRNAITQITICHKSLIENKKGYTMAFTTGNKLVIYLFDSACLSLIQATTFLITQVIEVVKDNMGLYHCEMKDIGKLPKNGSISALIKYNEMDKNGKLASVINKTLKLKEEVGIFATGFIVIASVLLVLYFIRFVIYQFYYVRISLSNYLAHVSDFVLMNMSTLDDDQKKIKEKQQKIADRLKKMSEKLAVDQNMSTERSNNDIKENDKEIANSSKPTSNTDIIY